MCPDADSADAKNRRLRGLRRKLSRLNRRPIERPEDSHGPTRPAQQPPPAGEPEGPSSEAIVYRRDIPLVERPRVPEGGGISIPLDRCVEGNVVPCPEGVPFYLIERPVSEMEGPTAGLVDELPRALEWMAAGRAAHEEESLAPSPDELTFLDLETTGLGSSPLFLIGTLVYQGQDLVVQQLLARTYAEEAAILRHFVRQAARRPVFVSFNGKSFDVPYLRVRALATGVSFREPEGHVDLLHEARRRYRRRLPDCKLQTLERYICGRHRGEDIPSHDIPRAYHDFVRTGDAREMAQIIDHNLHDLVTMVHLLTRMAREDTP
jgi:uncharacterized protein YprB with RNaseH-like and TPR domain